MARTLRLTPQQYERLARRRKDPVAVPGESTTRAVWVPGRGNPHETEFFAQLVHAGLAPFEREYQFAGEDLTGRRWRFDFAWPRARLAVEIDGAVHRIRSRFEGDREKGNSAVLLGWRVLHFGPRDLASGEALSLTQRALQSSHSKSS